MNTSKFGILQRLRLRENQIFFALTIILGILCGLASVLFSLAIEGTRQLLFGLARRLCDC